MSLWVYIDGKYVLKEEAKISVFDHGFLYGDGVFEGIRAYQGRVFKLNEHLQRLYNSAKALTLRIPLEEEELKERVLETLRRNNLKDAYIRLIVSRGEGDLGLDPEKCPRACTLRRNNLKDAYIRLIVSRGEGDLGLDPEKCPRACVIIITDKIKIYPEEFYEKGLSVITASTRRNISFALDPQIKSLNYLNNILAKIEANLGNVPEAIMLNKDGYVAECTGDNIFMIKEGILFTPPLWVGVLKGITRDVVIELARKENISVKEEVFSIVSLYTADECFLTGTAAEIIPVTKVDGRVIGEGKAGKITRKLIKEFRDLTSHEGTPIW